MSWGENTNGQLGDGSKNKSLVPIQAIGPPDVQAVAAGYTHSLSVRSDGTVWGWGLNDIGALGDGTTIDSAIPVQARGLSSVVAVAAGGDQSVALDTNGQVWTWGGNFNGELGNGTTRCEVAPKLLTSISAVKAIAAGGANTFALKDDGTVWGWGINNNGQVGAGFKNSQLLLPFQVVNLTNVVAIAAGQGHTLALKDDGTVWAWGRNNGGCLGNGLSFVDSYSPTQVRFDFVPPDQGNVLKAAKSGDDVKLDFGGGIAQRYLASNWVIYADGAKSQVGATPLSSVLLATTYLDTGAVPRTGDLYYRTRGVSQCTAQPGP